MFEQSQADYVKILDEIEEAGLYKRERVIESPQSATITVAGREVLNFCANNYLGLANNSVVKEAAKRAIDQFGFGLSSVRFICGTQTIHKELEAKLAKFLSTDDTILYSSCFDANGGLFETILSEDDAIISDALNHASIIDGIRLCKAKRYRYEHSDLNQLEEHLKDARNSGLKKILVATDGVFSMDGDVAKLPEINQLCEKYQAMLMVDDSHATGFFGNTGRGSVEHCGMIGKVDVITSTLGKALGGASGGFTTGRQEIIDLLRQRSRPYLFSNSLAPSLVAACLACLELVSTQVSLREQLRSNTTLFREEISKLGFTIKPGVHPIVPIMLGDAKLASAFADKLLMEGLYVIGFYFPVVPKGQARIRVQLSAAHSEGDVRKAIGAFAKIGRELGVI